MPAKRVVPTFAKHQILVRAGIPVLTGTHSMMLLAERKTPSGVPAKMYGPKTKRVFTGFGPIPESTRVHVDPLLLDSHTLKPVAQNMFPPDIAREEIEKSKPPYAQLAPLLVDRNIPFQEPKKRFVFESAKQVMGCFGKPESALVQVAPLFVEMKTQLSLEPTKRF